MPANNKNVVLISGAASGIGRAIAERFLAQGDSVHICDASAENIDELLSANPKATTTLADVGDRADVDRVFADLKNHHRGLNILINNASIINIASTAALFGYPLRSPYTASKWAQIGLTKTWAMELGPAGIRVNAVCPTSVSGPRIEAVIRRDAQQRGLTVDEVRHVYQRHTSMRTFVSADEVADTVMFLSSAKASRTSGQSLSVDGHTEGLSNWLD